MTTARAPLLIVVAVVALSPCFARAQMASLGACATRTSFTVPEGATRRVDQPGGSLSVFAEEVKDGSDKSHFFLTLSDWALAMPNEVLKKSEFERRLKSDHIAKAKTGELGARTFTTLDLKANRVDSVRLARGMMRVMVTNAVKHKSADLLLSLP